MYREKVSHSNCTKEINFKVIWIIPNAWLLWSIPQSNFMGWIQDFIKRVKCGRGSSRVKCGWWREGGESEYGESDINKSSTTFTTANLTSTYPILGLQYLYQHKHTHTHTPAHTFSYIYLIIEWTQQLCYLFLNLQSKKTFNPES